MERMTSCIVLLTYLHSWTGSIYFSSLVRTEASRKSFATKLINAVEEYDLNGLNIDWGK